MKELTILSVKVNPFAFPKAVALVLALSKKYLDYEKLGVKVFELEDFPRAVELLKTGNITKAIFQISE
jgi:D-arabinitol dehydrogenase (NADP+)